MCKKSIWTFVKYYCFVWCSVKKRFYCKESSNNKYLYKDTYAGYESISFILLGLSMSISTSFYDKGYMVPFLITTFILFIYTLSIVSYIWFYKLNDIFNDWGFGD
jgi:uncharacterized Tic20 family protein